MRQVGNSYTVQLSSQSSLSDLEAFWDQKVPTDRRHARWANSIRATRWFTHSPTRTVASRPGPTAAVSCSSRSRPAPAANSRVIRPTLASARSDRDQLAVLAEDGRSPSLTSPSVALRLDRVDDRRQQVARRSPPSCSTSIARCHECGSRCLPTRLTRSTCSRSAAGSMRCSSGVCTSSSRNRLTPTTICSPASTSRWTRYAASWISRCWKPAVDGLERAAHRVDLLEIVVRGILELVGQPLDEVAAGERVRRGGHAALVGDDLLRAQRQARGRLRRQRQRLVARVRVQALGAAEHRGQCLDRRAHHVVVDRLRGQAASRPSGRGSGTSWCAAPWRRSGRA